jgi:SAM-dependent methyltransferase
VTDWFEEWFGEEYLALYPERDQEEAEQMAELIHRHVMLAPGSPALDLACGAGRHMAAMSARWWTVGLDLSPALLRIARAEHPELCLLRGDMRWLPFRSGTFALVANLFTSFGYFREDEQHVQVVSEIARVLRQGGWLVLDYLNAPHVRRTLVPVDERRVGSRVVEQRRHISEDGRFVIKSITLADEGRVFSERVRLFEVPELRAMLAQCGLELTDLAGNYDGAPWSANAPRAILFARRR